MQCGDVRPLLPEYLDELLKPEARRRVDSHLQSCDLCRAELATQNRALIVLERAAHAPAPDLWQAFSQRLASEITCTEVSESLPAYHDAALSGTRAVSVHNHLKACAACAAESEGLQTSLELLERAAEMPVIDLWPAFQARQEADRRSRETGWGRLRTALRVLWDGPVLQPALGLAAAGVLIIVGQHFFGAPQVGRTVSPTVNSTPTPPTRVATSTLPPDTLDEERRMASLSVGRSASGRNEPSGSRTERNARAAVRRVAGVRRKPTTPARPWKKAPPRLPAEQPEKEVLVAAVPDAESGVWTRQLQVSYDLETGPMTVGDSSSAKAPHPDTDASAERPLFQAAVEVNSNRAQAEVKSEVVQVVQLLAGIEAATENPFRSETDGYQE